ncbi:MAG: hypothetical protein IPI52_09075 [Bacteroidetes bacterium]|nr:hypothetical protein [Bacteroidota bacterium]
MSTGFEYRPLPRLSLGGEFGMGYNNVFEKRIYTNKEIQKEYKDKDFDKYFIWRTALILASIFRLIDRGNIIKNIRYFIIDAIDAQIKKL